MTEQETPASPPKVKAPKPKKTVKPRVNPSYKDMVLCAVKTLKGKGASRQAILKCIKCEAKAEIKDGHVKTALRRLVINQELVQVKGIGASGSFKINKEAQKAKAPTKKPAKKLVQKVAKKTPKKPATPKKAVKTAAKKGVKAKPASKKAATPKKNQKKSIKLTTKVTPKKAAPKAKKAAAGKKGNTPKKSPTKKVVKKVVSKSKKAAAKK